jgi:inositol-pentakisphosphate 2-kinase
MASFEANFNFETPLPSFTHTAGPGSAIIVSYLSEGAANVIWEITPVGKQPPLRTKALSCFDTSSLDPDNTEPVHRLFLQDKLLRLRKGVRSPTYIPGTNAPPPFRATAHVFKYYDQKIKPLFSEQQLVNQEKVQTSYSFIEACNRALDHLEVNNQRQPIRVGWHIKHEEYGLLITSMKARPRDPQTVEFKPKWLAQSPTAPPNARRCRTCALAAFWKKTNLANTCCPLRLVNEDTNSRPEAALPRWGINGTSSPLGQALSHFFRKGEGHTLLTLLHRHQTTFDPKGVITLCEPSASTDLATPRNDTPDSVIGDLSLAMTLRDCTLFTRITPSTNEDGAFKIDARFADLDPKSGDDSKRLGKWYWDEIKLIEGGWYTGTEELRVGGMRHQSCLLWREY